MRLDVGEMMLSFALKETGRRIKNARVKARLTQDALANMAGVSRQTIISIERGNGAAMGTVRRIMKILKIDGESLSLHELLMTLQGLIMELAKLLQTIELRQPGWRQQPAARKKKSPNVKACSIGQPVLRFA